MKIERRESPQVYLTVSLSEQTALVLEVFRPRNFDATVLIHLGFGMLHHANAVFFTDKVKEPAPVDAVVEIDQFVSVIEMFCFGYHVHRNYSFSV